MAAPAFGANALKYADRVMNATKVESRLGIQAREGTKPKEDQDGEYGEANLATVAHVQEFGSTNTPYPVPARSFLRSTADTNGKAWVALYRRAVREYGQDEDGKAVRTLKVLGVLSAGQVRNTIRRGIAPELAESTKDGRARARDGSAGSPIPLIDTGQLINAIRSEADLLNGTTITTG